jgi:hypothetical protein
MESINTIQKYPAKAMRQHNKLSNLIVKKMSQLNTTSSVLKRNLNAIFGLMSLTTVICLTLTLEVQAQDMAYSGQDPVVQSGNENGPVGSPIAAGYLVRTKDGMRGVPVTENSTMAPPPVAAAIELQFHGKRIACLDFHLSGCQYKPDGQHNRVGWLERVLYPSEFYNCLWSCWQQSGF